MTKGAWGFWGEPWEFWGPWGGPRRGRGRGRRRRQWFGAGDMKYVILKLLKTRPMHGYEVMKELEERTRGCYKPSPGTVYPTLQWLEDEGLVKSDEVDGKKVYSVTESGEEFLNEHRTTVDDIFDRVEETMDSIFGEPMPDVTRHVGRIVSVAYRTSWKVRDDQTKLERVNQILDDAVTALQEVG